MSGNLAIFIGCTEVAQKRKVEQQVDIQLAGST
jgi:hypothetical protein